MPELARLALAAGGHPLIDFDSTVIITFAIFLVTLFLLSKLLFRPYLEVRTARDAGIIGARAEALRMDEQARATELEVSGKLDSARLRAAQEHASIRKAAAETERQLTDSAKADAARSLESARTVIAQESATAKADLDSRKTQLAHKLASQLLGREVSQ